MTERGRAGRWLELLSYGPVRTVFHTPSVLCSEVKVGKRTALGLAIVPDAEALMPRARHGEMGLEQAWALSAYLRSWLDEQRRLGLRSPVLAIVDTPGQAFGRLEEQLCISAACASAVDAYVAAHEAGHPLLTLVVGRAISGSFLAHGLQGDRILALDVDDVLMHAMSEQSIARITRRTVDEVREASSKVAPMSYSIAEAYRLGIVHKLIECGNAEQPTAVDVATVRTELDSALASIDDGYVPSLTGNPLREATLTVERRLREEWKASERWAHAG